MARKVLLDTDTLLDACMSDRPDWTYVDLLLDDIARGKLDAYIAATSLEDACRALAEQSGQKAARELALAALDAFTVVEVNAALCRLVANSDEPDFGNGVLRACAEGAEVDFIISRNEKAFLKSPIKRLSARDYAKLFCEVDE